MRYPKYLKKNGTIGFVAPSFGCNIEPYKSAFENAQKTFTKMGYQLDLGPNCYEGKGIGISNTPIACANEFTEYYCSDKNDVLISCGGGELMCEILEYVDFNEIANADPKWFMGFSDNTNLTFLLTTLCDTASIYAPCAASFGAEKWVQSHKDAMGILTGRQQTVSGYELWEKDSLKSDENPLAAYNLTEQKVLKKFPNENIEMSGRLIGGCMDSLVNLTGTQFDKVAEFVEKYKDDGFIWFLESCDLNVFSIRRAMWQLKNAGWFQYAKGFLIGRPLCFGQELMGLDQYQAVMSIVEDFHVPVIMDVDFGHLPPAMPIICGSMANVTTIDNDITIEYIMK